MVFPTPGTNPRSAHDPCRRHHREPGHRRAHRLPADEPRDERPGRRDRDLRAAERLRRGRARPPEPGGALRGPPRQRRLPNRPQEARRRPRPAHHRPRRHAPQVLERGRGGGPLRLRGAPRAPVRGAARDEVRPRRRRQDEPEGHAAPAVARGDRERALRHRPAPVPAGHGAADRPRPRRSRRPAVRLRARLRPRRARGRRGRRVDLMRRRLFFTGLIAALLALAALGLVLRVARVGAARRASWPCCAARSASSAAAGCSTCSSRAAPTSSSTPSATPQRREPRAGPAYAGPVRILLVSQMYPGPDAPDLGTFVAQVERELATRGHEIERAVLDTRAGGKLRYLTLARRAHAAGRPDVVYAHFLVPSGLIAALAGGAPLVVTAHGRDVRNIGTFPGVAAATRLVVRRAVTVICVSDYLRRELETKLPEAGAKVEVVSSGVDRERFAVTDPPAGPPAFLCVGALDERKNVVRL